MKVQNEMSTRISVDAVSAIGSMSAFRNAIKGASDAWRAQETALRNAGNYTEAIKSRISGLNRVIDLQKAKVEELRQRQEGLDTSNKKQATQFLKLEKQIQQANKQLASYESQATRARNAARQQVSGLTALQHSYRQSQAASTAFINRLNAEGKSASATVAHYRQLRSSLTNLESQYRKQEFVLKQIANDEGKNSAAYQKQRIELDKTATNVAKTRNEMKSLQSTMATLHPTGISRVDNAVVKMRNHTAKAHTRMVAAFDGIKSHMFALATTAATVSTLFVSSVNKASAVQKTMVENQNLMSTAGEKSAAVQREVNQMYSDGEKYSVQYGVSQKTIASGYQELIKRGYDGAQALGAMKSILQASRASGDDFNDTMKVTTSTLEAFGMRSETTAGMMRNTAKVADILAKGADVTSTDFKSLGEAMTYAGSSAKSSGVSLKETTAILGVLSNNGLEATQAGTGLQRILTRLAAPTDTAKNALKKYNMSIDEFKTKSGKLRNVNDIFKLINKNVPKGDRLQFFNKVFGQTAQNAAAILSRTASLSDKNSQSLAKVENQLKTAYSEDYAGKLARKNMNSAKNSQDRFKYASEAIQIEIGRNMLPALSKASAGMANAFGRKDTQRGLKMIAKGMGAVAMAAVKVVTAIGRHTTAVKVFGTALLTAFASVKLLNGIGKFRQMLPKISSGISTVGKAVKIATLGFNPWVIAIEAIVAGFVLLYKHSKKFRGFVNGLASSAKSGMKKVGKWFSTTFKNISKNHAKAAKQQQKQNRQAQRDWNKHMKSLKKAWTNFWKDYGKSQQKGNKASEKAWSQMSKKTGKANDRLWKDVRKKASNGWKNFERSAQKGAKGIVKHYQNMQKTTGKVLENMRKQHPRTFNAMYKEIQDRSKLWHDLTSGNWSRLGTDTANIAKDMYKTGRSIFSDMYDKLNDLTGGRLNDIRNTWNKVLNSIRDAIVNIGATIHKAWDDLLNGIIGVFGDLINGIIKGINWIVDKVGGSGHIGKIKLAHFATGTNGPIAKRQMAVLNDAPGNDYREMVHKHSTGKTFMLPAKRNIMMPLEPGDEVLDGKRSAQMMQLMGLPHYANGSIGSFFSGIFDKVGDAIDDATDWVEKALKNVVEFGKELFSHFTHAISVKPNDAINVGLKSGLPGYFANALKAWLKKQLESMDDNGSAVTPEMIRKAARRMHVSVSAGDIAKILNVVMHESRNQAHAINNWDSNAQAGTPSKGVLQFIDPTFNKYAVRGHHNIWKPFDQILALFNDSTWRSDLHTGGWGPTGAPRGFANGGYVGQHGIYEMAEGNNPEMVIPLDPTKRGRAYDLLAQVVAQFKHEDQGGAGSSQISELGRKFDALLAQNQQMINLIDKLIGVTDSANNPTARYKRTQRDINFAQFQSLT